MAEEKYPMCKSQDAQIDCRCTDCTYYNGSGHCNNISPAITLNPDKSFVCWSHKIRQPRRELRIIEVYQCKKCGEYLKWADNPCNCSPFHGGKNNG